MTDDTTPDELIQTTERHPDAEYRSASQVIFEGMNAAGQLGIGIGTFTYGVAEAIDVFSGDKGGTAPADPPPPPQQKQD